MTDSQKRFAGWAAIAGVFLLMLWFLAPVLAPFIVASVLAYALTPLVDRLDAAFQGRVPRVLAVVLVELLFVLLALGHGAHDGPPGPRLPGGAGRVFARSP